MISIGNDIIDLSAVDGQRSIDFKFFSKFITASEQALCNSFSEYLSMNNGVWLLWSIKEAVYKCCKRSQPDLIFSPINIVVRYINIPDVPFIIRNENSTIEIPNDTTRLYTGEVITGYEQFRFRSTIQPGFISTIVDRDANFEKVYWGVSTIFSTDQVSQSGLVRHFALSKLQELYANDKFTIIKSSSGCPIIFNGNIESKILLSLAHHNRFVSYCFKTA